MPTMEPLAIGIALLVIIISSLVFACFCLRGRSKGRVVCLLGLSNSGKTLLFMRLVSGGFARTQTSMKENKANYSITTKKGSTTEIDLVDVPGDERIRQRVFQQYIEALLGVVILIDSVNFQSRDVAHLLIDLLSEPRVNRKRIPIIIACNKQDLALASSAEDIRTKLENEITQILTSQSVKLSSLDQSKERKKVELLRNDEQTFSFEDSPNNITITSCSARGTGDESSCTPEIEDVTSWLNTLQ